MAFEADCGASTVLGAFRVASTARSLVPGKCQATRRTAPASVTALPRGPGRKDASNSKLKTQNYPQGGWAVIEN
jgi:hypothetical protein